MTTKTDAALKLIDAGKTVREAARAVDVSESAIHAAVKRRKEKEVAAQGICPCCGQKIPKK